MTTYITLFDAIGTVGQDTRVRRSIFLLRHPMWCHITGMIILRSEVNATYDNISRSQCEREISFLHRHKQHQALKIPSLSLLGKSVDSVLTGRRFSNLHKQNYLPRQW